MYKLHFKKQGCLHGKTQKEKNEFFEALAEFSKSKPDFFEEQHDDMLPHEQREFLDWIKKGHDNMLLMKSLVDILEELLKEKYPEKNK